MIRAVITWLIIFFGLLFLIGLGGWVGRYELLLVFLVSLALTFVALRVRARRRARSQGREDEEDIVIRAIITWLLIVMVLLFLIGAFGGLVGPYELLLVFLVSLALTFVALRVRARRRARSQGRETSSVDL